jgi:hypothetical protein
LAPGVGEGTRNRLVAELSNNYEEFIIRTALKGPFPARANLRFNARALNPANVAAIPLSMPQNTVTVRIGNIVIADGTQTGLSAREIKPHNIPLPDMFNNEYIIIEIIGRRPKQ